MNIRPISLVAVILVLGAGSALAEETTVFESCVDAKGRTLQAVEDASLSTVVATVDANGQRTIHYNPSLLPRLKPITRLFFFAQECARNALGFAGKAAVSAARARQADCLGLATMQDNGQMEPQELAELQEDLNFSDAEWAMLPGPARSFDLAACHSSGVVKLPLATAPSTGQSDWDGCVRHCADPLLACGSRCFDTYQKCVAGCGERPKK
jgi:hypothetical protein